MKACRGGAGERGFALLIVLWTMVLLALVVTQLVSVGRGEAELAANLRTSAVAEAAADAALYQAIFRVLDPSPTGWAADGTPHTFTLQPADARAVVSIVDLGGRINPNTASADLLASLLTELGADRSRADAVAAAIVNWRTPDVQGSFGAARYAAAGLPYRPAKSSFQSLDELGLVLGMTPSLLALLAPHLSLANPDNPDPARADAIVLRAMKNIGMDPDAEAKAAVVRNVSITAAATTRSGARFERRATVRLGSASLYQVLSWDSPALP